MTQGGWTVLTRLTVKTCISFPGHLPRLCIADNISAFVNGQGFQVTHVGPSVRFMFESLTVTAE
jgi:hypothetical protein